MKKIISAVFTVITICSTTTTTAFGQKFETGFSGSALKLISTSIVSSSALSIAKDDEVSNEEKLKELKAKSMTLEADLKIMKAEAKALKANAKAATNFQKNFKNAANAKWNVEEQVIVASFTQDEIQTDVVYDKKGNLIRTMHVYLEDKLPVNIKSQVRSDFPSYKITSVQEIKEGAIMFYVLHIENNKGFKKLFSYDGELSIYQEYDKQ